MRRSSLHAKMVHRGISYMLQIHSQKNLVQTRTHVLCFLKKVVIERVVKRRVREDKKHGDREVVVYVCGVRAGVMSGARTASTVRPRWVVRKCGEACG